ncbi:MAG: methyltransferase domain-containing protein [Rhodospirillaceae bacterium]|nr:methyltransferase domain-containing protein [Rhodospirillaceae bacterium]
MQSRPTLFDRSLLRRHRDRAVRGVNPAQSPDFLLHEAAERLLDRLTDILLSFPLAIDLGAHTGQLARLRAGRGNIETLISVEPSAAMAALAPSPTVIADEDALPFSDSCADLILSCMSLHWIDDLPGLLAEAFRVLKPGGLFLASLPGEETLHELRDSLARAELAVDGGISPRISPMLTIKDAGSLLQMAGFIEPVVDRERLTVDYQDPMRLLTDLRAMGETNTLTERRKAPLSRTTLLAALATYRKLYGAPDGRVYATFDLLTLTAWKAEA